MKQMKKRLASLLLATVMLVGMVPTWAMATDDVVAPADVVIIGVVDLANPTEVNNVSIKQTTITVEDGANVMFTGTTEDYRIIVDQNATATITFNGVSITRENSYAFELEKNSNVTLILMGDNLLAKDNDSGTAATKIYALDIDETATLDIIIQQNSSLSLENSYDNISAYNNDGTDNVTVNGAIFNGDLDDDIVVGGETDLTAPTWELTATYDDEEVTGDVKGDVEGDVTAYEVEYAKNADFVLSVASEDADDTVTYAYRWRYSEDADVDMNGKWIQLNGEDESSLTLSDLGTGTYYYGAEVYVTIDDSLYPLVAPRAVITITEDATDDDKKPRRSDARVYTLYADDEELVDNLKQYQVVYVEEDMVDADKGEVFLGFATEKKGELVYGIGDGVRMPASDLILYPVFAQVEEEAEAVVFLDTINHWAQDNISAMVARGLFAGVSETMFAPESNMTRAMMTAVLYRMAGEPDISDEIWGYPYADVDADLWYTTSIYWARMQGIADEVTEEMFLPNQDITREGICVMLYNYANAMGIALPASNDKAAFLDESSISPDALEAVLAMQQAGIISGRGGNLFAPQATATRAEICTILELFFQMTGE